MSKMIQDDDLISERMEHRLRAHAEQIPVRPLTGRWRTGTVQVPQPPARGRFGFRPAFALSGLATAAAASAVVAVALVAYSHGKTPSPASSHPAATASLNPVILPSTSSMVSSGMPTSASTVTTPAASALAPQGAPTPATTSAAAQPTPTATQVLGANLLQNGSFDSGSLTPWQLNLRTDLKNNTAAGTDAISSATSCDGGDSAVVDVTSADATNPWHINFVQPDLPLQSNHTYTVSFWAKADGNRPIAAWIQEQGGAYQIYTQPSFDLTTACQHFSFTMPGQNLSSVYSTLRFIVGQTTGKVWIDGVTLG